jgi:hypothetical protein
MSLRRPLIHCALSLAFLACVSKSDDPSAGSGGSWPSTGAGGHDPTVSGAGGQDQGDHPGTDAGTTVSPDGGTYGGDTDGGGAADAEPPALTLRAPSRGSAVALSDDDAVAVVVNRDTGSASVLALHYAPAQPPSAELVQEVSLGQGSEPWQAVIDPTGDTAYVVLRKDQKIARIRHLRTYPELYGTVSVGSEPTSIALSPTGARAYVTNWVDGTVSEIDTHALALLSTIDLNPALVATGYLGAVAPRPSLAHPRSIVATNDGDAEDADEALYVTEYYAQQSEPEAADGSNSDTRKVGIVYRIALADRSVRAIPLGPLADMGFKDERGGTAGCYPNQLQSIALNGSFAYVVSVCASPKGPIGVKATTTACVQDSDCASLNLVEPACVVPFAGAPTALCVDVASVKTTTAPVVSVIDTRTDAEVAGAAQSLNARFDALYRDKKTPNAAQRFPLFADDVAFISGTSVGYLTANGVDAVFRFTVDPAKGNLIDVGASTNLFIDLNPAGIAAAQAGKNPIGLALTSLDKKTGIIANDVSRNATLVDFNTQAVAGGIVAPSVVSTSALPAAGSDADRALRGKRFFDTGTARWSLRGQGWGACQSCHADGLTDNVTWYFARGPRQATSLDGSFASKHPEDQRVFN